MADLNERESVQLFVDGLTDYAIVVLDSLGNVRTWNAGARALLGYATEDVVGTSFSQLCVNLAGGEFSSSIDNAAQLGRHETIGRLLRKDGTKFDARIVLRPLLDTSKKLVGFGLIADGIDRSRPKIMVVDDNKGVLGVAVDQLTSLGYR